jgi:methylated-DNA-[protein]-cysteine S-methyltransferase
MIEVYSQNRNGTFFAVALENHEVVAATFSCGQEDVLQSILFNLPYNQPFQIFYEPTPEARTLLQMVIDIYEGKETTKQSPLATKNLPVYTKKVLKATLAIPKGYVTSYGAIAKSVGGGARAVGNAMACNRFAPIVPCHRVIKSDFGLGGYSLGGVRVKLEILKRERRGFLESKVVDFNGFHLSVFPVEWVLAKFV